MIRSWIPSRETALACLLGLISSLAWGQTGTGAVQGTVRDSSNAAIPHATVTLTNTATDVTVRTTATEIGFYIFPGVVPGPYRLSVEAAGMQKFEGNLILQVQQTAVIDPVLRVGQMAAAVSVSDVTPLVTTDSPTVSAVMERERIEQLPIGDRSPTSLVYTVPGVISNYIYGRAYGIHEGATDTLVDGASTVDRTWGDWQPTVRLDAVQEFKVETNNSSAKFSRPVTMIVSTRSGTNVLHGSLYEAFQNSAFVAARKREDFWSKAPTTISNQFGASAGGPVVIPHLYNGRNRTFWFVSYEGSRSITPKTQGYQLPTAAMRQGDFSGLVDAQGRLQVLYDPWSTNSTWGRQPFSYGGKLNVIDPSRISPVAKYLYSIVPLPNLPSVNPLVDYNYWTQVPIWANIDSTTVRLDHQFSAQDRFFARATVASQNWIASATGTSIGAAITDPNIGRTFIKSASPNLALSYTHVFSPTLFNELLLTGAKIPYQRNVGTSQDFAGQLGLPNPFGVTEFPALSQTGLTALDQQSGAMWFQNQGNVVITDNATKVWGRHELEFGGSFRYEQLNFLPVGSGAAGMAGTASFNTLATSLYDPSSSRVNPAATPQTGNNLANFFLGVANYAVSFNRYTTYARYREGAAYFQDNYRVTPSLTVNLGVRWEYYSGYSEKNGIAVSFDPQQKAVVLGADLSTFYSTRSSLPAIVSADQALGVKFLSYSQAGYPQSLTDPNWKNIGPRLGFAWRLGTDKRAVVLRGGYRISYSSMPVSIWTNAVQNDVPLHATFSNSALTDPSQSPDGISNYGMRSVPTTIAGINSRNAVSLNSVGALTPGSASMVYFNRSQPDTQLQDWNLTLEKEILPDTVARAAYIGNHGGNLPSFYSYNDAPPDNVWYVTTGLQKPTGLYANVASRPYDQQVYGSIREYGHKGWSNFNGLQLVMERRFSHGLGGQLSYNLNNVLATVNDNGPGAATTITTLNQYLPGTVPSDLDARNRFLNYQRDPSFPQHKVNWNWVVDIPVGKGKRFAGNAGRFLDKVIGSWQLAGLGSLNSTYFTLPTSIYPTGAGIQVYGYKYPIQDCRSGVCYPGYLWWNGYIPANQINAHNAAGNCTGVCGVPSDYQPAGKPLIPWGSTALPANAPAGTNVASFWDTNTVWVPLKDGTVQRTTYNPGLQPWQNQYVPGVMQWGLDASLYKAIRIKERITARLNVTFFNVLNHPGNPNSIGGDGVLSTRTSGQSARRAQATLRLTW